MTVYVVLTKYFSELPLGVFTDYDDAVKAARDIGTVLGATHEGSGASFALYIGEPMVGQKADVIVFECEVDSRKMVDRAVEQIKRAIDLERRMNSEETR